MSTPYFSNSGRILAALIAAALTVSSWAEVNRYQQVNLVANRAEFEPQLIDPLLINPWGIALRPPAVGGHFWTSNAGSGTTTTYVGDVPGLPIFQDDLRVVDIPSSMIFARLPETLSQPTGQVFCGSRTDFIISGEGLTGPSRFIFCTLDGTVSAWTTGMTTAVNMIDTSAAGSAYTGMAITDFPSGNRLYLCDFGLETWAVYDEQFRRIPVAGDFRDPNVWPVFSQYNMQLLDGKIFVAWARLGDETGEEDAYPGYGYISEFDLEGRYLASYEHGLFLNAPWGLAIAPDDFGALSGALLAANFGDGTIIAFDRTTRRFIDYLRDRNGEPVVIDGIWGLTYGNGDQLGRTNHLYFTAGPNNEEDGIFGKLFHFPFEIGDMNCDGARDFNDIEPFVLAVISRADYRLEQRDCEWLQADFDGNGVVDFADIGGFVGSL